MKQAYLFDLDNPGCDEDRHRQHMILAHMWASGSPDPSTHVGAVLVGGRRRTVILGECNNLSVRLPPAGTLEDREVKNLCMEHAERRAIYRAARLGVCTTQGELVVNWGSCSVCARGIVESGIKKVVVHKQCMVLGPERWREEIDKGWEILRRGEVEIEMFDGVLGRSWLVDGEEKEV